MWSSIFKDDNYFWYSNNIRITWKKIHIQPKLIYIKIIKYFKISEAVSHDDEYRKKNIN